MLVDLHNHTPLCNHATGTPMQYVEAAIKSGCKYFGFSDHAPMDFDPKYRMRFDQMDIYEAMVEEAKLAYEDEIEVFLGYEVDFLDKYMDDRVLKRECDYLIGSVHFLNSWGFDNPEFIDKYQHQDIDKIWEDYFLAITNLAKSGLFDIVGHLDLIKVFKFLPKKDIRVIAKEALDEIKKADIVVEINSAGYRKPIKEQYPSDLLIEELANRDIPITFGSDAHKPEQVGFGDKKAVLVAKDFGYSKCALFRKRDRSFIEFWNIYFDTIQKI